MPNSSSQRLQEQLFWITAVTLAVGLGVWKLNGNRVQIKQPSFLRDLLSSPIAEETQVIGLRNLGNTCFMNAVLQALGSSVHMLNIVSRGADKLKIGVALNETPQTKCSLDFLQKLYALLVGHTNDPSSVHQALTNRVATFQGFNQQDAHEFLLFVLDMMSDALEIKQAPPVMDLSNLVREPSSSLVEDVCLPCTGLTSSSLVCSVCNSTSPTRLASFNVLSLSISASSSTSLEGCLRSYSQAESVDGVICSVCSVQDTLRAIQEKKRKIGEKPPTKTQRAQTDILKNLEKAYFRKLREVHIENLRYSEVERKPALGANIIVVKPEGTIDESVDENLDPLFDVQEALVQAKLKPIEARRTFSKRLSFARTPSLLCLQIQRLFGEVKNSRFVQFPLKLDVAAFSLSSQMHSEDELHSVGVSCARSDQKDAKVYHLRAVVVHLGVSNSGHFITYRQMKKLGSLETIWYYVSDEQVRPCDVSEVLKAEAYLLFYEIELG